MNVTLENVVFQDPGGVKQKFEVFFAPNRLIRYVQIPPQIDIKKELEKLFGEIVFEKALNHFPQYV